MDKETKLLQIGNRIKERREMLCMSQEDLAFSLGYKSRSSVNKIEKGKNDIPQTMIARIAEKLMTTPSYLMGWDDDPTGSRTAEQNTDSHQNTLTLGAVVSGFRTQERMTVEQFAALSGLSVEDVAMLERHLDPKTGQPITPALDVYAAVAKAMGTTTDELRFIANGTRDVPQEQKASYQLTDDEEKLIKVYRRLPTDKKEVLLIVASSMAGETENKKEVI